jgi:putative transposase
MDSTLPVTTKCQLLELSRSTAYYKTVDKTPEPEELTIKRIIDELHMKHPFMGV